MDKLVYVAMTGAKQVMRQQGVISSNLANVNTDGFRADLTRFTSRPVYGAGHPTRVNSIVTGDGFDNASGTLMSTGQELDIAIRGAGFIAVQDSEGNEAYTRSGALRLNSLGLLESRTGELVLGDNGPVAIPEHKSLKVGNDGTISIVPKGQGPQTLAAVARIKLVNPEPTALEKGPDGLLRSRDGGEAAADASVQISPGFLETSNVNLAETMVGMIELARQFEMQIRMMRAADENSAQASQLMRMS